MGIDKWELEHHNWRSVKQSARKDINDEMVEQLDTSIVPEDDDSTVANINEHAKTY